MSFTISVAMIVKNEAEILERCLSCLAKFADEIIVVDTGSEDGTVEIAKKMGAKTYDFKWINDFSAARNFSFNKATKDWIMWIDADDIISNASQQNLVKLKQNPEINNYDCISCTYLTPDASFSKERLVKRSAGELRWTNPVHEYIENLTAENSILDTVS